MQGSWRLSTVTPARFQELTKHRHRHARWHLSIDNPNNKDKSLMQMEQDVCPAIAEKVPQVFYGIMRRTCAGAMRSFFWVRLEHPLAQLTAGARVARGATDAR